MISFFDGVLQVGCIDVAELQPMETSETHHPNNSI